MKCPLCDAEVDEKRVLEKHGEYKLYGCPGCTNGFWWPMKGQTASYYEDAVDEFYEFDRHKADVPRLRSHHAAFFRNMGWKGGKLLDVGCAEGGFLAAAKRDYEVYGIDFDAKSVASAKRFGLANTAVANLAVLPASFGTFDIITFFEVLEHQENPQGFIAHAKRALNRGGFVAGSVPLHESIKPVGEGDVPPHHFILFTREGIRRFLELSGFSDVLIQDVFGDEQVRRASGVNTSLLKRAFSISDSTPRDSMSYRAYSAARRIGVLLLPAVNLAFRAKSALMADSEKNRIKADAKDQFIPVYFQARLA